MHALTAAEAMDVWEAGQAQSLTRRALLLLSAGCGEPAGRLSELSIGQRDARLLRLREQTFGARIECLLACPDCGEQLELEFQVADILVNQDANLQRNPDTIALSEPEAAAGPGNGIGQAEVLPGSGAGGPVALQIDGYRLQFRLPNSLDLLAVTECQAGPPARRQLLERCLVAIERDSQAQPVGDLPNHVADALAERMAAADPQADVQLKVECPGCGCRWQAAFDIVSFFWSELNSWAQHTLYEVHTLAWAYGWSEAEILGLSAWRRRCYLEMVKG